MKRMLSAAALLVGLGALLSAAQAQDDRSVPIAPSKTLGDEGKLPPTAKVAPPEMGATAPAEIGTRKRMGDEGTLPATKGMSGATPEMSAPASPPAE